MHVALSLAGSQEIQEPSEALADDAGDVAHPRDLLRTLDHAQPLEHGAPVGQLDPREAIPQPQEVGYRHPEPGLGPGLPRPPVPRADELADRLDEQAHPLVGRPGRRPRAHVRNPAGRREALDVRARHDRHRLALEGDEHEARPRRANPDLRVEARQVPDVALRGQEQAREVGVRHQSSHPGEPAPVLGRQEFPAPRVGLRGQASHPVHAPRLRAPGRTPSVSFRHQRLPTAIPVSSSGGGCRQRSTVSMSTSTPSPGPSGGYENPFSSRSGFVSRSS